MSNQTPPPSRSATPPPLPASGPLQNLPLSPIIGPLPQPIARDAERLQSFIDGLENISMLDLQYAISQLAAWNVVEPQFSRTVKDFTNAIHNRMKKEEGGSTEAWTQANSNITLNPYRQSKNLHETLLKKFKGQFPHFNMETMTGSLSTFKVIVYKKANSSESGGLMLIFNQQAPSLSQYSEPNVRTFVNRVKTQHASGVTCNIAAMVPVGPARNMLRNILILKTVVANENEFEHILTDTTLFLSHMDRFLKKLNLPTGAPTELDMIRQKLMFLIDTVLNDAQVEKVIEQISQYDHDCRDTYLNSMGEDHRESVSYTHLTLPTIYSV